MNATIMPTVRWMIKGDFRAVLEIERQSFDEPWTENDFVQSLQNKNHRGTAMGMVHETVADDGLIEDGIVFVARAKSPARIPIT